MNKFTDIAVKIQANAGKTAIAGLLGADIIKIKLKSPAVDNKANNELIAYLSKIFDLAKSDITIISGAHNSRKIVRIGGISKIEAMDILLTLCR